MVMTLATNIRRIRWSVCGILFLEWRTCSSSSLSISFVSTHPLSGHSTPLAHFKRTETHAVVHKAPLRLLFHSDGNSTERAFILRYTTGQ